MDIENVLRHCRLVRRPGEQYCEGGAIGLRAPLTGETPNRHPRCVRAESGLEFARIDGWVAGPRENGRTTQATQHPAVIWVQHVHNHSVDAARGHRLGHAHQHLRLVPGVRGQHLVVLGPPRRSLGRTPRRRRVADVGMDKGGRGSGRPSGGLCADRTSTRDPEVALCPQRSDAR